MERRLAGSVAGNEGRITMRLALLAMADVSLCLQSPEDSEHGRVGEVLFQLFADLRHRCRPLVPQDGHYIELAFSKRDVHSSPATKRLVNSARRHLGCQLGN